MKRFIASIILAILTVGGAMAQGHVSAATRMAMHRLGGTQRLNKSGERPVRAFITVDSPRTVEQLRGMGVSIQSRFGGMVTAQLPLSAVSRVCRVAGVRQVSVAQVAQVCNDSALADARVLPLMQGAAFARHYDGSDVVVGIIDSGVDFNHINLCDAMGSRVAAAYLPQDSTGVAPVIDGDTLPGSHYNTPEQIARLTTDCQSMSHGTHTIGTMAGSCFNGFQGVAPRARLVVCAMSDLYDTDIANSLKYIFDYADSVGLPCVVNMSFASIDGPHDGTSALCQLFDQLSGPGRLISLSANNSGYAALHLTRNFKSLTDTLSTTLELYTGSFNNVVSLWSSSGHRHAVAVTLIDKTDKRVVLETPYITDLDPDSIYTMEADSDAVWSQYVSGTLLFATGVEDGDRSHSILVSELKPFVTSRYRIGLKVVSDGDPKFNAWVSGGAYFRALLNGQTAGTKAGTISDLATGDKPISVGAYITKQTFPLAAGGTYTNTRATPLHDIAYFTAWGPDARGKARPDICAPGMVTISSANRYDTISSLVNAYNLSFFHTSQGVDYPYSACYGTSMSAPVMTGAIALWMQAKPDLSPDDVRDILDHTAVRDAFVVKGDARQWGRGKLDVEAGMRYLLRRINPCDVNADGAVDVADVNMVVNMMLGKDGMADFADHCDITGDGAVDVADINAIINNMLHSGL